MAVINKIKCNRLTYISVVLTFFGMQALLFRIWTGKNKICFCIKIIRKRINLKISLNIYIFSPDYKFMSGIYSVCKTVIAGKSTICNKNCGLFSFFISVYQIAVCLKFILFSAWLKFDIKISLADNVIQRNSMNHVIPKRCLFAWFIVSIRIIRISVDIKLASVNSNKIVLSFINS